jgi:hypothetical protein
MQPHSTPPIVSPGRLAAAFFGGGAVAGAVAAVLALAARFATEATGVALVPSAVHLIAAVVIGVVMALSFLVAKVRGGPVAPVAAAAGALIAERAGWLAVAYLTGFTDRDIAISLHLSMSDQDRYTMLSWASAVLAPMVAGGLTAAFTLRTGAQQPGPSNGRPPGLSQDARWTK